jgi:hypothetical protein
LAILTPQAAPDKRISAELHGNSAGFLRRIAALRGVFRPISSTAALFI